MQSWRATHPACKNIELFSSLPDNTLMGRRKNFSREQVLEKAIPVFWQRGFSDTSLEDLERATGVNKSGLYSEFRDKEDLFVEVSENPLFQNTGIALLNTSSRLKLFCLLSRNELNSSLFLHPRGVFIIIWN